MTTEADTCRKFVVPKLQKAGWDDDPHSIAEQRFFTDGRIVVRGNAAERKKGKRADYILRYTRDFPIAVVEAKALVKNPANGLQQAKEKQQVSSFSFYSPEAREILNDLLEKYAVDGELQFTLPDVLKLPPISEHGNVNEIIGKFGGAEELREAVEKLQTMLYAA